MACGNVVRPLSSGSRPRRPCRYSGSTNVSPMKLAMPNAMTRLVARNSRWRNRRSASIGCGRVGLHVHQQGERDEAADRRGRPRTGSFHPTPGPLVEGVGDRRQAEARTARSRGCRTVRRTARCARGGSAARRPARRCRPAGSRRRSTATRHVSLTSTHRAPDPAHRRRSPQRKAPLRPARRSIGGKARNNLAAPTGTSMPPPTPTPCSTRSTTSWPRLWACPHSDKTQSVNIATSKEEHPPRPKAVADPPRRPE